MARIEVGVVRAWVSWVALFSLVAEGKFLCIFRCASLVYSGTHVYAYVSAGIYEMLHVIGHVSYMHTKYAGFEMVVSTKVCGRYD